MKNSTFLFGLVILVTLLSMISKGVVGTKNNSVSVEKEYQIHNVSIHNVHHLPIVSTKKD